jgi:hypothetical protein
MQMLAIILSRHSLLDPSDSSGRKGRELLIEYLFNLLTTQEKKFLSLMNSLDISGTQNYDRRLRMTTQLASLYVSAIVAPQDSRAVPISGWLCTEQQKRQQQQQRNYAAQSSHGYNTVILHSVSDRSDDVKIEDDVTWNVDCCDEKLQKLLKMSTLENDQVFFEKSLGEVKTSFLFLIPDVDYSSLSRGLRI